MKFYTFLISLMLFCTVSAQIKFDSNFESGNLKSVTTTDSVNYSVTSNEDIGGRWFYFRITGVKDKKINVTITNSDVNGPFYSYDNRTFWRFTLLETDNRKNYFSKTFEQDTVYVSYYNPYTFSYLQQKIGEWLKNEDVTLDTLGHTTHNLPIQMLTITDRSVDNKEKIPVWIHARTHPSETPSSWHLEGLIKELLSGNELVNYYKKNIVFYIVPFTNPDGVYYGRSRTNYNYVDVESNWNKSPELTTREVQILKAKMKQLADEKKFAVFLNLHSQASPYCTFWIHTASSTSVPFYHKQYFFSFLNVSQNPYFTRYDFRESNLSPTFPEGWLYANYGPDVLALTYETPYDKYSTGKWVTNENLYELGEMTVNSIGEFLELSHPKKIVLDNPETITDALVRKDSTGLEYFGNNFLILNKSSEKKTVTYQTDVLPAGTYDIDAWWPSNSGLSANARFTIRSAEGDVTVEKSQKLDGGKWNSLSQLELNSPSAVAIEVENNSLYQVVADAFRIVYKGVPTGVAEEQIPQDFALYQNYPNPFNPETTIRYSLERDANVRLVIYDILGKEVRTLTDGYKPAGVHEYRFNASELSSGMYIYRLTAGSQSAARKMMLIK